MIYRSFVFFFFLIIRHPPRSTRTDPLFPYTTLFRSEVFRGALLAIPKGHREAGLALGLGKPRIFTRLILPQMWRLALPGLGNLFMILMKDTALVSVIRSEEHTSELQSLMRISYAVFCLKKKTTQQTNNTPPTIE